MFLQPKKVKYKKIRKGSLLKKEFRSKKLKKGTIGLKAAESGIITSRQLEAARQAVSRKIKRMGKVWLNIFPAIPITKKPAEARMGKGKGSISHWAVRIKGGQVLIEICGIPVKKAIIIFRTGGAKLPIKTFIIS